jgi:hypothetical protein
VQAVSHCPVRCISGSYLGSIRGSFPRTLESGSTGTSPGDNITFHISNSHNRIVETGLDVGFAFANLFMSFLPWHMSE